MLVTNKLPSLASTGTVGKKHNKIQFPSDSGQALTTPTVTELTVIKNDTRSFASTSPMTPARNMRTSGLQTV